MASPSISQFPPQTAPVLPPEAVPCVEHLVTEDDTPVDNWYSEKQQRLLTEPLYSSWSGNGRRFVAGANVGMFYAVKQPPVVPDALLSLDVELPNDLMLKRHRSYFFWEYGKAPEVALEVVSNREGDEAGGKMQLYARLGIPYYIIWDPAEYLGPEHLRVLELRVKEYVPLKGTWLPVVGLGVTIWRGEFEGSECDWLRWCDAQGVVIPTGAERAETEHQRAEQLAAQLRALGADPER